MAKPMLPLRTQHEDKVLKLARKWARMKLHRAYVDENECNGKGAIVTVCGTDQAMYLEAFQRELFWATEQLLLAMAVDEKDEQLRE